MLDDHATQAGAQAEVQRLRDRFKTLASVLQAFAEASTDYPRILETVARSVAEVVKESCVLLLVSGDGETLLPVALHHSDPELAGQIQMRINAEPLRITEQTILHHVVTSGKPSLLATVDMEMLARHTTPDYFSFAKNIGLHSMLMVALRIQGRVIGILIVSRYNGTPAPLDEDDVELAQTLADYAALALDNARSLRRVQEEIVQRKWAEDALLEGEARGNMADLMHVHEELARQRDVFNRFFMNSVDMLCIAGVDGFFKRINPAFLALGYSEEELLARPFLEFVHEDDRASTLAEVAKLSLGIPTIYFENRYRCKDGSYRWLNWATMPDERGTLYAIARDVTNQKNAALALERAKNDADVANRELEAFSYSVAHDLRAPLRSIDGFAQALVEDYGNVIDERGQKYLRFLRESAQQMAQLIDDLLTLSRVTRSELERERVDLSRLARVAINKLRTSQPDRQVEVIIADGMEAEGDARLLAIVFDNLASNAWKFTSKKRGPVHIEFGTLDKDGQLVYFVRDNGAGFNMAYAGKLFGVFQRLHTTKEFEGAGIGLATVQRVVRRHGGRVWADGEVDRGATFYFTLNELSSKELTP